MLQARDKAFERFRREARAVAQLSHPHIVGVIDAGEDEGRPYIVFEYVEGLDVSDLIDAEALSLEDSVRIVREDSREAHPAKNKIRPASKNEPRRMTKIQHNPAKQTSTLRLSFSEAQS